MDTPSSRPPNVLGLYEVAGVLAGGGMATVYVGRPWGSIGTARLVALKVIKDEFLRDVTYIHMFLDEARILSRLSHPNIVETLEFGVSGDTRFIAMELLLGRPLSDLWQACADRGARIPAPLAAWICSRVGHALHYAHELRDESGALLEVIHRDVNPTNIFLTYEGAIKLIDFGLAKSIGRKARSAEGIVKGKVPYLSPEQLTQGKIDRRSDIYTLGATLWELTTGRRLFKRENDAETIKAILARQVPHPGDIVPGYPEELWTIVRRALEADPDKRYGTASEMARALDDFLRSQSDSPNEEVMTAHVETFLRLILPGEKERDMDCLKKLTTR